MLGSGQVHLDKAPGSRRRLCHRTHDRRAVQRLPSAHIPRQLLYLVGLKLSDEVPLDVGTVVRARLGDQFLGVVLPQPMHSSPPSGLKHLDRVPLRDAENGAVTAEALTAAAPTAEEISAVSLSKLYVYYGSHEARSREGEGVWLVLNPGKKDLTA